MSDSISREALNFEIRQQLAYHKEKAKLTTINNDKMTHSLVATGIQLALDIIDNAPTVEDRYNKGYADGVQGIADEMVSRNKHIADNRPQGEWIVEENNKDYPDGRATCSCCNYKMDVKRWEWLPGVRWYLKPNYCPECGADMRKGEEE